VDVQVESSLGGSADFTLVYDSTVNGECRVTATTTPLTVIELCLATVESAEGEVVRTDVEWTVRSNGRSEISDAELILARGGTFFFRAAGLDLTADAVYEGRLTAVDSENHPAILFVGPGGPQYFEGNPLATDDEFFFGLFDTVTGEYINDEVAIETADGPLIITDGYVWGDEIDLAPCTPSPADLIIAFDRRDCVAGTALFDVMVNRPSASFTVQAQPNSGFSPDPSVEQTVELDAGFHDDVPIDILDNHSYFWTVTGERLLRARFDSASCPTVVNLGTGSVPDDGTVR
jgi:hypothetical protein